MKKALQDEPTNGRGCVTVEPGLDHARMHDLISSLGVCNNCVTYEQIDVYQILAQPCACNHHVEDFLTGGLSFGWRRTQ
jgi:hypothetical protein